MSIRRRDTKKGVRYDVRLRGPDGGEAARASRPGGGRLFEAEQRRRRCSGAGGSTLVRHRRRSPRWPPSGSTRTRRSGRRPSQRRRDAPRPPLAAARQPTHRPDHTGSEVQALIQAVGRASASRPASPVTTGRWQRSFNYAVEQEFHRPLSVPEGEAPEGQPAGRSTSSTPTSWRGLPRRWVSTGRWSLSPPCSVCDGGRPPGSG